MVLRTTVYRYFKGGQVIADYSGGTQIDLTFGTSFNTPIEVIDVDDARLEDWDNMTIVDQVYALEQVVDEWIRKQDGDQGLGWYERYLAESRSKL